MSEVKDWCEKPRVTNTVGNGWCVRISGTDVFDNINQYGCKTLRTFDVVRGLSSEQEAKAYLVLWLSGQLLEQGELLGSDAQRLRADTAEAELKREKDFHAANVSEAERMLAAAEQRIAELAGLLQHCRNRIRWHGDPMLDRIEAALNPKPEAGSHE